MAAEAASKMAPIVATSTLQNGPQRAQKDVFSLRAPLALFALVRTGCTFPVGHGADCTAAILRPRSALARAAWRVNARVAKVP
eukprot:2600542-Pyramimonas_sp.AAC.1